MARPGVTDTLPIRPLVEDSAVEVGGDGSVEAEEVDDGMGAQEGEEAGKDDEEGRKPATMRAPHNVSQSERDDHETTHTPYRTWCRYCVLGRGRRSPHKHFDGQEPANAAPKISLDYFFLSETGLSTNSSPIIVMVDESTGDKYARVVENKGPVEWLIKDLSDELKSWGHGWRLRPHHPQVGWRTFHY